MITFVLLLLHAAGLAFAIFSIMPSGQRPQVLLYAFIVDVTILAFAVLSAGLVVAVRQESRRPAGPPSVRCSRSARSTISTRRSSPSETHPNDPSTAFRAAAVGAGRQRRLPCDERVNARSGGGTDTRKKRADRQHTAPA
jgi:hypothetical protein